MRGQFALAHFASQPWALAPRYFENYASIVRGWAHGDRATPELLASVRADAQALEARRSGATQTPGMGAVRVLPLYGVITARGSGMDDLSGPGSTSAQAFAASLRDAVADDTVGAILIDIDSPGGSVYGIQEAGDEIYKARGSKPIVGISNALAASAAYWLASQCSSLFCTPSGEVGSIGVLCVHEDYSEANKQAGVAMTYISAGPHKVELNPDNPPTSDAIAYQQARIDAYYSSFTRAVAKGRAVPVADVRSKMGGGRVLGADDALSVGMICGIKTFSEALAFSRDAAKNGKTSAASNAVSVGVVTDIDPIGAALAAAPIAAAPVADPEPSPAEPTPPGLSTARARNRIASLG